MRILYLLVTLAATLAAPVLARGAESVVTGAALIRERIALPPDARFEAVIVDAGRADAPAPVLARAVKDPAGQSPIHFEIRYDESRLDPRARYVVRATITIGGKLVWTSDAVTPAPVRGGGSVELILRRVGSGASGQEPPAARASLRTGSFLYMADAAVFEDCRTGRRYPVAMDGAYLALEKLYLEKRPAPGAPLVVSIEGRIERRAGMEGPPRPTVIVGRVIAAWPGESCARHRMNAAFAGTDWRIVALRGESVGPGEVGREPQLIFRAGERPGLAASVGCNRILAGFKRAGRTLTISPAASTQMACPPALAQREQALTQTLGEVRSFAISGSVMALYGAAREPLMVLLAAPGK